ncbi:MAG TPA: glycerol kinase GlpK [Acidimicrobiia bacterium]|nr:glycerol kinase GlpK [Acidimicrobiia bacterium]
MSTRSRTDPVVVALDAGTTGVRALAVDAAGTPRGWAYREFPQYFPRPGWVEHDAEEIWNAAAAVIVTVTAALEADGVPITAIGITNQRETAVTWSRSTGRPRHRAIVWQDRRTAPRCDELRDAGVEAEIRTNTGLVLDPYFTATKWEWLFAHGDVERDDDLMLGTVDSWLLWKLTGGPGPAAVHATDPSNASRTMLFDLHTLAWSDDLCSRFDIPQTALPAVRASSGRFGMTDPEALDGLRVPVSGIVGDQPAALFGQACFTPGMAKNTYGTGSFVLMNLGDRIPEPADGLLTSVAWTLDGVTTYAMEGAIFVTGAAIQWLRDGLGIIDDAAETGPLAASTPDTGGVYFVPAFTGLGSPSWDPYARGAILGLTRGSGRAQLARATVEAMAFQTADVIDAMTDASGARVAELRVDGGASVMDLLCAFQADLLGVPVRRSAVAETAALGAAYLAGLAEGFWSSPADAAGAWREDASFSPTLPDDDVAARRADWARAVARSRSWVTS